MADVLGAPIPRTWLWRRFEPADRGRAARAQYFRCAGRLAGLVYMGYLLTTIATEQFIEQAGAGVRSVSFDVSATAAAILTHEAAFRLGFALSLIAMLFYVGVAT